MHETRGLLMNQHEVSSSRTKGALKKRLKPALLFYLAFCSPFPFAAVRAITVASSGLRLEIGPVFSVIERPVRTWTCLLGGELSLNCEGFLS